MLGELAAGGSAGDASGTLGRSGAVEGVGSLGPSERNLALAGTKPGAGVGV